MIGGILKEVNMKVKLEDKEIEVQEDKGITILHYKEIHVADACLKRCLDKLISKMVQEK